MEKLPEKWCILRTEENYEVVNKWFNEQYPEDYGYRNICGYIHSEDICVEILPKQYLYARKHPDFTEITFEQFKKYVMKEEKEIIGYKLVKPQYMMAAADIVNTLFPYKAADGWADNIEAFGCSFAEGSVHKIKLSEAGVLDLWFEPVYEEKPKEVEHSINLVNGYYLLKITKDGVWWEEQKISIKQIESVISDWQKAIDIYNELKK